MLKQRLSLTFTLICALLLLGIWGFYEPGSKPWQDKLDRDQSELEGFITGMESIRYDEQGKPKQRVIADNTYRFSQTLHSQMIKPDILIYREQKSPLHLEAEEAEANADQSQIWLRRNVTAVEQQTDGMRIETDYLRLEPDADFAETHVAVTLVQPSGKTEAIGMKAYLADNRVELLKDVRGVYERR